MHVRFSDLGSNAVHISSLDDFDCPLTIYIITFKLLIQGRKYPTNRKLFVFILLARYFHSG